MIDDFSQIVSLFEELDEHTKKNADVFLIGGGALMRYDLRDITKDIDIVVSTEEEYWALRDAFRLMGFGEQLPDSAAYVRMAISNILIRDKYRADLFCGCVCGKFVLSERMKERATLVLALKRIRLFTCSLSDIFLFKSMTERDGDLTDCYKIATEYEPDWDSMLDEAERQSVGDHGVWIDWITDRMEKLAEKGAYIPILDKMISLSEEYIKKWGDGLLERNKENY